MKIIKFESKTIDKIVNNMFTGIGSLSGIVSLISGTIYIYAKDNWSKGIAIGLSIVALIIFLKVIIYILDSEFEKLEDLVQNQKNIKDDIQIMKNDTNIISNIDEKVNEIYTTIPKIEGLIDLAQKDIECELFDFILINDKEGDSGNLLLIVKCDKILDHTFELTIISNDIDYIRLFPQVPVYKNYNVINMDGINKRELSMPYIKIQFKAKRGLNIGIIKINLEEEIDHLVGIRFNLKDLESGKVLIKDTDISLEVT